MGKLFAVLSLLRQGVMVADPVAWKKRQISLIPIFAALFAALKAFGLDLGVSDEQIAMLATGLLAVINGVLTVATTDKMGLPAKPDRAIAREPDAAAGEPFDEQARRGGLGNFSGD